MKIAAVWTGGMAPGPERTPSAILGRWSNPPVNQTNIARNWPVVIGQAAGHRFRFLCCPQSDAKGSPFEIKAPISNSHQLFTLKRAEFWGGHHSQSVLYDGSDLPEELWAACRRTPSPSGTAGCTRRTVAPGPRSTCGAAPPCYCSICYRNSGRSAGSDAAGNRTTQSTSVTLQQAAPRVSFSVSIFSVNFAGHSNV